MDPKTLAYITEATRLLALGLEVFNLAATTLERMKQAAQGDSVTDADLEKLKAEREAALDRLGKLIG